MQRMTPLGRLIVILLILGAVFAGLKFSGLLDKLGSKKDTTETTTEDSKTDDSKKTEDTEKETKTETNASSSFSYTPPAPSGGKMKGVVELGASGFNSFIVTIDAQKNWKLEKADYGHSLVKEGMASEDDIRVGLKNYISDMLNYGVGGNDIHFVVSSGAVKEEVTAKIINVLKGMKYYVNTVTPEQEGILALKCVLPKEYENNAFVVDIGSGNTKITWKESGKYTSLESYGSKYFQKGSDDKTVYDAVLAKAKQVPDAYRKTCFIIGGVPFNLAKQVRAGKERFTVLKPADAYELSDKKDKSGANIYKAISEGTGCQQFVFDFDSNFTIGFLLDLP
jgi:hypothetical protein